LIGVAAFQLRRSAASAETPVLARVDWTSRDLALLSAALAAAGAVLWSTWPQPLIFATGERWKEAFEPARADVALVDLAFTRTSAGPVLVPGATIGAVALDRAELAPLWHGTLLPDLSFTGTLAAQPFTLQHRFLVTPFCGWPSWNGSALRWRLRNPATGEERWPDCVGRNPQGGFDVWIVDAAPYRGWEATLFLFDGRTDHAGWIGVARPAATDDSAFGPAWRAALKGERAEATHRVLVGATLLAAALALAFGVRSWRTRSTASTSRAT
jgi:hypothetical protein